jgi:hypothetical protein
MHFGANRLVLRNGLQLSAAALARAEKGETEAKQDSCAGFRSLYEDNVVEVSEPGTEEIELGSWRVLDLCCDGGRSTRWSDRAEFFPVEIEGLIIDRIRRKGGFDLSQGVIQGMSRVECGRHQHMDILRAPRPVRTFELRLCFVLPTSTDAGIDREYAEGLVVLKRNADGLYTVLPLVIPDCLCRGAGNPGRAKVRVSSTVFGGLGRP